MDCFNDVELLRTRVDVVCFEELDGVLIHRAVTKSPSQHSEALIKLSAATIHLALAASNSIRATSLIAGSHFAISQLARAASSNNPTEIASALAPAINSALAASINSALEIFVI